ARPSHCCAPDTSSDPSTGSPGGASSPVPEAHSHTASDDGSSFDLAGSIPSFSATTQPAPQQHTKSFASGSGRGKHNSGYIGGAADGTVRLAKSSPRAFASRSTFTVRPKYNGPSTNDFRTSRIPRIRNPQDTEQPNCRIRPRIKP
uniref:Uncharacterized protein n=1 Tax=Oryza glaberrima TaxID=4538 RepID=I1QWN5_ORYGL